MQLSKGAIVTLTGALVGIVGVFLPWANIFETNVFKPWGTSAGYALIVIALLASFGAWKRNASGSKGMSIVALVMAILFIGIVAQNDPSRIGVEGVEKLYGFNVAFGGALIMLVGSIMGMMKKKV